MEMLNLRIESKQQNVELKSLVAEIVACNEITKNIIMEYLENIRNEIKMNENSIENKMEKDFNVLKV